MTTRVSRRTQAERRSESERGLVQAAVGVIASQGVGAVTFESVGRAGGFSRGLATQRFGSKQGLIDAVLGHLHDQQQSRVRAQAESGPSGLAAVLDYVGACLGDMVMREETRAYFMMLSSAIAEANDTRGFFRETHAEVEQRLAAWVAQGQAAGTIRADVDPGAAALMIGCLLFGMSMQLMVDPAMDLAPLRTISLAMLKSSLSASPAAPS
jgi:AcrR family transcriptional regulator